MTEIDVGHDVPIYDEQGAIDNELPQEMLEFDLESQDD